jgi:hypothetical protein
LWEREISPRRSFEDICKLCIQCSRGLARNNKGSVQQKGSGGGVTKEEIGNLLDNLRTDILSTLSAQDGHLASKTKAARIGQDYGVFCPKCRKKHPERECPLNSIEECAICELNHATSSCPSLPGLKAVFQGMGEDMEQLYLMGSRKPWQPRPPMGNQGMYWIHLSILIIVI